MWIVGKGVESGRSPTSSRKEMNEVSKARTAEVKPLEREKKGIGAQLETYKKIFGI
jgi:hypothetical protein